MVIADVQVVEGYGYVSGKATEEDLAVEVAAEEDVYAVAAYSGLPAYYAAAAPEDVVYDSSK